MDVLEPAHLLTLPILQPYLVRKFKITDTCGVNNLHGMPAIFGGLLSVLMAGIATKDQYDQYNIDGDDPDKSSLQEIFPEIGKNGWTAGTQAGMQMAAMVVTLVIAVAGGFLTGEPVKARSLFYHQLHLCFLRSSFSLLYPSFM